MPVGKVGEGCCGGGKCGRKGFPEALEFAGEKSGDERGRGGWKVEKGGRGGEDRSDVAEDRGKAWFG